MKKTVRILGFILAGMTGVVSAAEIFVDAAAAGANNGTSWADAYTTIQAAVDSPAFTSTSDATILVASGTYNEQVTLTADNSGASGAPNRIQANTSGAVVIDGGATRANGIAATGVSWLVLDGLSVTNATAEGIKFLSLSTNNVLTNVSSCGNTGVGLLLRAGFIELVRISPNCWMIDLDSWFAHLAACMDDPDYWDDGGEARQQYNLANGLGVDHG